MSSITTERCGCKTGDGEANVVATVEVRHLSLYSQQHYNKALEERRMIRLRILVIATAICLTAGIGWAADLARCRNTPGDTPDNRSDTLPFAFSISGGISLGSYEAGLNWAFIRYLQAMRQDKSNPSYHPPKLASVAGTSAGSINAFLTAATWCRDETLAYSYENHVGSNLFSKTWLNVDLEQLMKDHGPQDAVLSRKAFDPVLALLEDVLNAPIYWPGCEVPVGIIVTRNEPVTLQIDGIAADNDRFVIPLVMKAGSDRRLTFEPYYVSRDDTSLGNAIYPQGNRGRHGNIVIPVKQILEVLQASSAFPVAFGQKELKYCIRQQDVTDDDLHTGSSTCPDGYLGTNGHFVDGGVFDNIPLGTTRRLAETGPQDQDRPATYLYMDPGNLRSLTLKMDKEKPAKEVSYGLLGSLRFVGGALATGTTYELYHQLRSGSWNQQSSKLTSRAQEALQDWQRHNGNGRTASAALSCAETYAAVANSGNALSYIYVPRLKSCLADDQKCLEASEFSPVPPTCGPRAHDRVNLQQFRTEHTTNLRNVAEKLTLWNSDFPELMQKSSQKMIDDRRIFLSSRYSPLTGDHLYHFGAFIDRDFRRYDYYAGLYDAVINLAQLKCSTDYVSTGEVCLNQEAQKVYQLLKVQSDKDAAAVFATLARKEFGWIWPQNQVQGSVDRNIAIIAETFMSNDFAHSQKFPQLIQALKKQQQFEPRSLYLQKVMAIESDDELVLLYPVIQDGLARLRDLVSIGVED